MVKLIWRTIRVILVSMLLSVWVLMTAEELIVIQLWGFPRSMDVYACVFVMTVATLFCWGGSIAFWVITEQEVLNG